MTIELVPESTAILVDDHRYRLSVAVNELIRNVTSIRWDDLRFPASGLNPPGPVNAPTTDTDSGLLVFADNATNVIAGLAQMPHAWLEGSEIRPHIHWIQPSVGNVVWRLEYKILPAVNGPVPAAWTEQIRSTTTHVYPGTGNQVMITPFAPIDMTGQTLSAMVLFKVSRLGSDAADTVVGGASMLEFDIHYQIDSNGSTREFKK